MFFLLFYYQTTRRPDFFEISPRPFSVDDGYRQTPLTFTRGQPSLKADYYDTGYSGNTGQTSSSHFRQTQEDLLAGEEINVHQVSKKPFIKFLQYFYQIGVNRHFTPNKIIVMEVNECIQGTKRLTPLKIIILGVNFSFIILAFDID